MELSIAFNIGNDDYIVNLDTNETFSVIILYYRTNNGIWYIKTNRINKLLDDEIMITFDKTNFILDDYIKSIHNFYRMLFIPTGEYIYKAALFKSDYNWKNIESKNVLYINTTWFKYSDNLELHL